MSEYIKNNKVIYLTQYHIIWCPKYRRGILKDKIKDRLQQIIEEICQEKYITIKKMEIMPDHIHLFISMSYKETPYKIVKLFKGRSSNLLRKEFPELLKMPTLWSGSFFISTIGNVSEKTIIKYIEDQWKPNK